MPNATSPPWSMTPHQDPDAVLRDFAADLNARGFRVVGMVQAGQCADSSLSAVLLHSGEKLLLAQDFDPAAQRLPPRPRRGCRMRATRVADALAAGADLVIINRFGKRERDGKGLSYLIERALDADIPVVIAVWQRSLRRLDQVRRRHERQARAATATRWTRGGRRVSRHSPLPGAEEHIAGARAVEVGSGLIVIASVATKQSRLTL